MSGPPVRRVEDVRALLPPLDLVLFWNPDPTTDGRLGPSCLSQWWPAPFESDGERFPCAEHYMMWRKAVLFGDLRRATEVLAAPTPARAKALGREVTGYGHDTWVKHRWEIVVDGSTAKFGQDAALRSYLLGTGDAVLVEASPEDRIWGIGLSADDPDAHDPARWPGTNLLGFALMEARERLG